MQIPFLFISQLGIHTQNWPCANVWTNCKHLTLKTRSWNIRRWVVFPKYFWSQWCEHWLTWIYFESFQMLFLGSSHPVSFDFGIYRLKAKLPNLRIVCPLWTKWIYKRSRQIWIFFAKNALHNSASKPGFWKSYKTAICKVSTYLSILIVKQGSWASLNWNPEPWGIHLSLSSVSFVSWLQTYWWSYRFSLRWNLWRFLSFYSKGAYRC